MHTERLYIDYIRVGVYFRSMIIDYIRIPLLLLMVGVMVFNLTQRGHVKHGEGKRFASLYGAAVLLLLYVQLLLIQKYYSAPLANWLIVPATMLTGIAAYLLRKKIFVFKRYCGRCNAALPLKTTLYHDDNLCDQCRAGGSADSIPKNSEDGAMEESASSDDPLVAPPEKNRIDEVPRTVEEFDWEAWEPSETAVLCYIFKEGQVLLINKKRGLGKGKVNAPGGRIDPGETPVQTAVRELQEEVGLTPLEPYEVGRLSFVFTNGYSLKGHVFFAHEFEGELIETDEAEPFWVPVEEIPYGRMWEDDADWLPMAMDGKFVRARFIFEGERMLSKKIETSPRG